MNPSASALARAMECPSSVALPQVATTSDAAQRGSQIHRFVRDGLSGVSRAAALATVDKEHRATCEGIDFAKVGGDLSGVKAEAAYAYDVRQRTVRLVGYNIGRNYGPLGPDEIAGTNDFEGMRADGIPAVVDVKTGQPVTVCRENPQMMFHALVQMLRTGASEVDARILYVREDGAIHPDSWTFDVFSLEAFADELDVMLGRVVRARLSVASGDVRVATGDHCRYCPALQACPAYTSLARTMATDLDGAAEKIAALAPVDAGKAWALLDRIGKLYDVTKEALKAYAAQQPIPLANGQTVKEIPFERSSFNQAAAIAALRGKGATDEEIGMLFVPFKGTQIRAVGKSKKEKAA